MRTSCYILFLFLLVGCGASKKKTSQSQERKITVEASNADTPPIKKSKKEKLGPAELKADHIIGTALSFSGVRYKFGGTTKKGMDCSGLLYVAFSEHKVQLPRISYQMAEEGRPVRVKNLVKGDLLFFKTSKGRKKINHVGMVVAVRGEDVKFIHSTTSRGVIVSSLREGYWNYAFVKATRVL